MTAGGYVMRRRLRSRGNCELGLALRGNRLVTVLWLSTWSDRRYEIELDPLELADLVTDAKRLLAADRAALQAWCDELDAGGESDDAVSA